jgi:hypothetical protein
MAPLLPHTLEQGQADRSQTSAANQFWSIRIRLLIERRTRDTGNLRAAQLLLGHTKIESTVCYLGIAVDDALAIAEQVDV